jgi:hypothetical protein
VDIDNNGVAVVSPTGTTNPFTVIGAVPRRAITTVTTNGCIVNERPVLDVVE